MKLNFNIDVKQITDQFKDLQKQVEESVVESAQSLAIMTHAKVLELATEHLNSTAQKYKDAVSFEQIDSGTWVVSLDMKKAGWIEEGRKCVVYGNNKSHIPKILTTEGEIPIIKLKKGMLVLNQYGKWTEVIEIYDEHLVEKSKLIFYNIKACRYTPNNTRLHKREFSIGFKSICPICNDIKKYSKVKTITQNNSYCTSCFKKQEVYRIKVSKHLNNNNNNNKKNRNQTTILLTHDHKIMTQDGWKEIKNIDYKKDSIVIPSWSKCKVCDKDTYFGNDFCYDNEGGRCSSSFNTKETLLKGNHQSQKPESRANYLRILKRLQTINKTEERVEKLINNHYTCEIWNKNSNADFFREFPVKVKSDGKYKCKYYFLDFYNPKLNLALEIDGEAFHCKKRDEKRDILIKNELKCEIIRIPSKQVWKNDFYEKTLIPIIKNHSNEIKMLNFNSYKISKVILKDSSSINRRWDITVKEGESFVCNKMVIHNSGFMDELLNGKSAKISKDGKKYAIIPFTHNKNPSQQTPSAKSLTDQIRSELKTRNIPYKEIEKNVDGSPRLGRLHSFNIESARPSSRASHPALHGVSIYQRKDTMGVVKKDIMTFRVITEDHEGKKWMYPQKDGKKLFEKAFEWAESEWSDKILPEIYKKFNEK